MTALAHCAPLAAASLAAAVWQSALLALCVAAGLRLLPGSTAAARSLVWSAVFLLTLALPFAGLRSASSSARAATTSLHVDPRWALAVAALWAVLSTVRAARLLRSAVRLYHVARQSTPLAARTETSEFLARANASLCSSSLVDVPSVAGFFHRRILLPAKLVGQISSADLHQIVLHELEHLRRRDDWTNLFQKLALVVFPLNPVLLWVERQLCLERELACDDGVLQATGGAGNAYATCLVNLGEASLLRRGMSLALSAWERESELARRVHRVLRNPARQMRPVHGAGVAILTLAAVAGTGVFAAKCPRLITFNSFATPSSMAADAMAARSYESPLHPTLVKAVLPQALTTPATLRIPRKHIQRRRSLEAGARGDASMPSIVLIGWQDDQFHAPRWVAPASFQLTYAAVPTRTGWLFFQL